MKVPADQLQRVLGITDVNYLVSGRSLAVVDSPLGDSGSSASGNGGGSDMTQAGAAAASTGSAPEVGIDNFAFTPGTTTVKPGTQVTWTNRDDIPHTVDSAQGKFKSAALDTDQTFQFRFTEPGEYPYFCRIHPKMTGSIVVQS
jgi:plastocyanin